MTDFSSIPVRKNDERFEAKWWNSIRTALVESGTVPTVVNYASDIEYVDAKGSPASAGDFYYNTAINKLKVYNGTDWKVIDDKLDKTNGSIAPVSTNDSSEGYGVGSVWNDIIAGINYMCIDATATAAVWVELLDSSTAQTLSGKVIDGNSNTLSNLEHGAAVDNPSIAHGTTTAIVGVDDVQTLTNKTIGDNLTVSGDLTVVGDYYGGDKIEVTDPAITVNKDGAQSSAQNVAGIEVEMSDATNAHIKYDSTLASKWKVGELGSEDEVVTATNIQDVSNKAIIDPSRLDVKKDTYANLVTYALTASDGQLCFATDLLKTYVVHTSLLNEVGGGSGQGGINYITNYNAEDGLDDWTASGTITFSQETTSPMFDTASFKLTSVGADHSSDYVYTNFTVDNALIYNIIAGEFWVRNVDLTTGDLQVRIYDVDNAAYISLVSGEDILASTIDTPHKFKFQATDSVNYRLEIYIATTSTTAYDFIFDNVVVGPEKSAVTGLAGWPQYDLNVTGYGTTWTTLNAVGIPYKTLNGVWRIVLNVEGNISPADTNGAVIIDGVVGAAGKTQSLATMHLSTQFGNAWLGGQYINFRTATNYSQYRFSGDVELDSKPSWAVDYSNVVLSETTMNKHILSRGAGNSGETLTANVTNIPFTLVSNSVGVGWDGSTFTAPESGSYRINGTINKTASLANNIRAYIDGVAGIYVSTPAAATVFNVINASIDLAKGDVLSFRPDSTITLSGTALFNYISIEKSNTGSQTIAASEKVLFVATNNNGQSIPAYTTIIWNVVENDSHNAYNSTTGVWTVPRSGIVNVSSVFASQYNVNTYGGGLFGRIYNAGVAKIVLENYSDAGMLPNPPVLTTSFYAEAGSSIYVSGGAYQMNGTTLALNSAFNRITITME